MGFGPVAFADSQSDDLQAPGAPVFASVVQIDNFVFDCSIRLPETDADGNALTGLKRLAVATVTKDGETNPFEGQSMEQILETPNLDTLIVDLDQEVHVPGSIIVLTLPITSLGSVQVFAAACSD